MMMMVMLMMVVMMISMMLMDDDDVDDDDDYDDDLAAFQNDYYHARSKMTIITRSKTTPSRKDKAIEYFSIILILSWLCPIMIRSESHCIPIVFAFMS